MKVSYLYINIIFFFICFNLFGQQYFFVEAANGLNVRQKAGLSSQIIAKLPYGFTIEKKKATDSIVTINDNGNSITGKWIEIEFDNYNYIVSKKNQSLVLKKEPIYKKGFVFDGYLKELNSKTTMKIEKINQADYNKLTSGLEKNQFKFKKISSLDSIKRKLINHLEWTKEYKVYNFLLKDAIKSLKTIDNRKLLINQHHNAYTEKSAYYPELKILVLQNDFGTDMSFSIKTGETEFTIGNPTYIISNKSNTYRLNGYNNGNHCISYFFQQKSNTTFDYLIDFNWSSGICVLNEFYWINEKEFVCINKKKDDKKIEYIKGQLFN